MGEAATEVRTLSAGSGSRVSLGKLLQIPYKSPGGIRDSHEGQCSADE
jgi:hypothetical protein